MLKVNDWYFIPNAGLMSQKRDFLGELYKVLELEDSPNYVKVERWLVTKDRKYEHLGTDNGYDAVHITKYGKKVKPPPKAFQILYSQTVKEKVTDDQDLDTDLEYNED